MVRSRFARTRLRATLRIYSEGGVEPLRRFAPPPHKWGGVGARFPQAGTCPAAAPPPPHEWGGVGARFPQAGTCPAATPPPPHKWGGVAPALRAVAPLPSRWLVGPSRLRPGCRAPG